MEKENLTNEKLRNKFANQFELVSYAIRLADNMIKTAGKRCPGRVHG
jgi:DNA-directed RNA polymerase subunit omega